MLSADKLMLDRVGGTLRHLPSQQSSPTQACSSMQMCELPISGPWPCLDSSATVSTCTSCMRAGVKAHQHIKQRYNPCSRMSKRQGMLAMVLCSSPG